MTQRAAALDGVKVADFAWAVAGPLVTKMLAVHGATVVKVETNHRLDGTRVGPPFRGRASRNGSAYYTDINPGKLSVTLDLRKPEALAVAKRLCRWADVVNENFSPGIMARWGLGYDDLAVEKPSTIMLSSSMQGADGPPRQAPRHRRDPGGALWASNHFTGWPDAEPVGVARPYTDTIAPWFGAAAVLAALEHRDRTGEGQHIDLSQYEATMHMIAPALLDHAVNGASPGPRGERLPQRRAPRRLPLPRLGRGAGQRPGRMGCDRGRLRGAVGRVQARPRRRGVDRGRNASRPPSAASPPAKRSTP